ncbi:hypothetical protein Avbf_19082 [Armadillidium vulgare]|nr:hypothetical protein Avbf_19082 [Armadillidium vulgare]
MEKVQFEYSDKFSGVADKCTQTRDVYISPLIESNEYLDWFDEEDGNSQESSEFDLQKFEKSLLFPEQSYTLGTMGSVLWPENISDVTENTSIVARQPVLWPVNVSIPTGGYQHCGQ